MASRLTRDEAVKLEFSQLLDRTFGVVREYQAPEIETQTDKVRRLERTIDQMPDWYGWFLELEALFGHWSDLFYEQLGRNDMQYKAMRQRRDAMERAASYAKLRYDGASRELTALLEVPDKLPRSRSKR